jgi:hypothetical protein
MGGSGVAIAQSQAAAEIQVVERTVTTQPNKDTQIGLEQDLLSFAGSCSNK